jgi:hypothetical protein
MREIELESGDGSIIDSNYKLRFAKFLADGQRDKLDMKIDLRNLILVFYSL